MGIGYLVKLSMSVLFFAAMGLFASDEVSICLDEATMSQDQKQLFHKFLADGHVDATDYISRQFCKVGRDRAVFQDTTFDKFLQRSGFSEYDLCAFLHGHIPFQIRTTRYGDTMKMVCRSEVYGGVNNLYACIDVIPRS